MKAKWYVTCGALIGLLSSADTQANPRFDYLLHCGGCHLEDGSGDPPEVPDLRTDPARMIDFEEGRAYMVQVPGSAQSPMSDAALAEVLNWMMDTYHPELQGEFQRYTADEVARYRGNVLMDPKRERARILAED